MTSGIAATLKHGMETMADTMIEVVAGALEASFKLRIEELSGKNFHEIAVALPPARVCLSYARVAMEAMRKPSGAMRRAMEDDIDWDGDAVRAYSAAIDAGLTELGE